MSWVAGAAVFLGCMFLIVWAFFVLSYNTVRDAQRPQVQAHMPSGNQAFWRWLGRKLTRGDG